MFDPGSAVVIANPTAGNGSIGDNWESLGAALKERLGPVSLLKTEAVGHGAELARQAAEGGATTIVSFGGDGTHSEIVDGIMQCRADTRPALGILHAGTGGDFRKMVEGSESLDTGCAIIKGSRATAIDVGWVEYTHDQGHRASRHFSNITSMGMSGLVDRHVAASKSRRGGTSKYLVATIRAQLEYKPARVRLRVDGNDKGEYDVSVVCVCNGRWAGGGMMFAPNARVSDGQFDVIVMRAVSTLRGLPVMAGLYKGAHVKSSTVETFRGSHVEVDVLENTAYMDIDGEAPGVGPAEFRMHRGALRLIGIGAKYL